MFKKPLRLAFLAAAGLTPLASSVFADKLDLDRVTPVPDTEPIPALDFVRTPLLRSPKINRTGTHIGAIVTPSIDHTELMVYDLKTQKVERVGARGDAEVYNFEWLNPDRVLYQISVQKLGGIGLIAGKIGKLSESYAVVQYVGSSVIAIPPDDRSHPLVRLASNSINTGNYAEVVSLRTDVDTSGVADLSISADGKALDDIKENNDKHILTRYAALESIEGFDFRYLADKDGKLAYGMRYSESGDMSLHRFTGDKWIQCPEDLEDIDVVDCGDNPGEILVVGPRGTGQPRPLQIMDAASGKPGETILADKNYDFDGWLYRDPVSHAIVGAIYNRAAPEVVWFSEAYRNLQKVLDAKFPGMVVRILGTDDSGKIILIQTSSDRQPPIYNWVNLEARTAGLIKNSAPWIDPKRMHTMGVMKYKTRDGLQLDAYVMMPDGASKQNPPPLVVIPSDSAWDRHTWGYDSLAQFLASRGYAVLQPNHRGATGYRWMTPKEDDWNFVKMYQDVADATKKLVASGLVDSKRVGIYGTAFGGYLAMSAIAFEPDLYRCAVGISPQYDLGRSIEENAYFKYSDPFFVRMKRKLGDPKKESAKFEAMSPLRHADAIRAAVFISHGEYENSDELSLSKRFLSTLEHNQVHTESVTFSSEGVGVRRLQHKVELYNRIDAFLAKNLAGR